ncbi:MAG: hypothetical protein QM831_02750 [Kofleriaceae bacterium]
MSCLTADELAHAVTTGVTSGHLASCPDCRRHYAAEASVRTRLQQLRVPPLTSDRRRAIKAEIFAAASTGRVARGQARIAIGTSVLAIAGMVAVWCYVPAKQAVAPVDDVADAEEQIALHATGAVHEIAIAQPPRPPAPREMTLHDGSLEIDSREALVRVGQALVRANGSHVRITAHGSTIASIEVVVGAAELISNGKTIVIREGATWRPAPSGLDEFQQAWLALRAGHDRDAIALFDRAADSPVAEEAMYWAAIAAYRANDPSAPSRMAAFARRFPSSTLGQDGR